MFSQEYTYYGYTASIFKVEGKLSNTTAKQIFVLSNPEYDSYIFV
jgi:hypothetical protein